MLYEKRRRLVASVLLAALLTVGVAPAAAARGGPIRCLDAAQPIEGSPVVKCGPVTWGDGAIGYLD